MSTKLLFVTKPLDVLWKDNYFHYVMSIIPEFILNDYTAYYYGLILMVSKSLKRWVHEMALL